jgi:hypothetical protein
MKPVRPVKPAVPQRGASSLDDAIRQGNAEHTEALLRILIQD